MLNKPASVLIDCRMQRHASIDLCLGDACQLLAERTQIGALRPDIDLDLRHNLCLATWLEPVAIQRGIITPRIRLRSLSSPAQVTGRLTATASGGEQVCSSHRSSTEGNSMISEPPGTGFWSSQVHSKSKTTRKSNSGNAKERRVCFPGRSCALARRSPHPRSTLNSEPRL
eukprot:COSAG01_NODE_17577_length_1139_cov_4.703846_2_plen_171_part_00